MTVFRLFDHLTIRHGKDYICISEGMYYHIMVEKNSSGLYDLGLIVQKSCEEARAVTLYENLSKDQWRILKKSGELERIFEKADEIINESESDEIYSSDDCFLP